jgi:hypothetical protein
MTHLGKQQTTQTIKVNRFFEGWMESQEVPRPGHGHCVVSRLQLAASSRHTFQVDLTGKVFCRHPTGQCGPRQKPQLGQCIRGVELGLHVALGEAPSGKSCSRQKVPVAALPVHDLHKQRCFRTELIVREKAAKRGSSALM